MEAEIASSDLQRLIGVNKVTVANLAKRGVIVRGDKRGCYRLESITRYCTHLREQAAGRGGEDAAASRARLGTAQAELAEARAATLRGETLPTAEVEAFWRSKLKTFRARILGIGDRLRHLPPRDHVKLTTELRAALTELADDAA